MTNDAIVEGQLRSGPQPQSPNDVLIIQQPSKRKGVAIAAWREQVERQLDKLAHLPSNWNCMGAHTIHENAVRQTQRFLDALSESKLAFNKPGVNPTPSGGIDLEWEAGERSFDIEFRADGEVRYLYENLAEHQSYEDALYPGEDFSAALKLVGHLI